MKYAKVLKNSMESAIGITKAAKLLGVTVNTLDRWEFEGQLIPHARMPADGRLYIEAQLHGCEIPVYNQEQQSPEAEIV